MHIDLWTLAFQTINVLILVWLLGRFFYKPVTQAIAARQAAASKLLNEAEAARSEAAAHEAALTAREQAFTAELEKRRAEAHAGIETDRGRLLQHAKDEATAFTKQAQAANAAERDRIRHELEEQAATLAGNMAERLLRRLPLEHTAEAMFQSLLEHLHSLPEDERRKLVDGGPLDVVTPRPLSEEDEARFISALTECVPGFRGGELVVDPSLIVGFEQRGHNVLVRNSWRADLDEMLAKLRDEEDHVRAG